MLSLLYSLILLPLGAQRTNNTAVDMNKCRPHLINFSSFYNVLYDAARQTISKISDNHNKLWATSCLFQYGNIEYLLPPLTVSVVSLVVPLLTAFSGPWVTGSLGWQRPLPCLPACPPSSPQVCEPLPLSASQPLLPCLPHQGLGAKMDGEAEHSSLDGLIYSASFPSRQSWGP